MAGDPQTSAPQGQEPVRGAAEDPEEADVPEDPEVRGVPGDPEGRDDLKKPEGEDPEERDEPELDPEARVRRAAALARVRQFGDPVLRTRARPVERFDDTLVAEVERMGELMSDALGVGLAATQVGVVHRVLVYRVAQQASIAALVNPEIEWSGREQETIEEGCLSLPTVLVDVERPIHVRVRAFNELGERILVEASGLEARVIQHEIDHLDGVLILDRAPREQRKAAMRALREAREAA
ncbi:MAG: peptide deformylase [Solirubrobacteraceae bacterium]